MGAGIYTYRIEDGRDCDPPVNATVFIVTDPAGHELIGTWSECWKARAFCQMKNRQLKEESRN